MNLGKVAGGNASLGKLSLVQGLCYLQVHMGVSENSGTPKSSILIGFSIINHPFWGSSIFGNTHIFIIRSTCDGYVHVSQFIADIRLQLKSPQNASTWFWKKVQHQNVHQFWKEKQIDTVDGRNPAPPRDDDHPIIYRVSYMSGGTNLSWLNCRISSTHQQLLASSRWSMFFWIVYLDVQVDGFVIGSMVNK